jgi:hypothetical protein
MKIDAIYLRELRIPLVKPFVTSFGPTTDRRILLVEIKGEGLTGWGECVAGEHPYYSYETVDTAWLMLTASWRPGSRPPILPIAGNVPTIFKQVRGHEWPRRRSKTRSGTSKPKCAASLWRNCWEGLARLLTAAFPSASSRRLKSCLRTSKGARRRLSAHQAQVQAGLGH